MIATRSAYKFTASSAVLRSPLVLLQHRNLYTRSPLRREVRQDDKVGKGSKAVPPHVSQEVLKDRFEPGWAMRHARYTEEGEREIIF